ncbi:hypothetical protein GWK09_04825 [Muriicola jejuensis]|uniref:Uncharacterized protein n=1 Tax=Muriicola jejuensis TaxID=504488 RepID=A0A6P0U9W7_9FLAO|nr:hypothetical protein [Muriicola jejuensis]
MATLSIHQTTSAQDTLEIDPGRSMSIAGKGPGQDGAINPFLGQDSFALVENIGNTAFSIRIQKAGEIIESIPMAAGEIKKVTLLAGSEMYFDAEPGGKAMARVEFEKKQE